MRKFIGEIVRVRCEKTDTTYAIVDQGGGYSVEIKRGRKKWQTDTAWNLPTIRQALDWITGDISQECGT